MHEVLADDRRNARRKYGINASRKEKGNEWTDGWRREGVQQRVAREKCVCADDTAEEEWRRGEKERGGLKVVVAGLRSYSH